MLLVLAIILGIVWIFGVAVFQVASPAVHLLLLLAVVAIALDFLSERAVDRRAT